MEEKPVASPSSRPTVLDERFDALYLELRRRASQLVAREKPGQSVRPSDLAHEAYLRMIDQPRVARGGTTFFGRCFAAQCRRILVDRARVRLRRDQRLHRVNLHSSIAVDEMQECDLIELNDAIETLSRLSPRMAEVVDMRCFSGMTILECAEALEVSPRTVDKDWRFARAWLRKNLS